MIKITAILEDKLGNRYEEYLSCNSKTELNEFLAEYEERKDSEAILRVTVIQIGD